MKSQHQDYIIKVILKVTISTASAMTYAFQKFHFSLPKFFLGKMNIYIGCTSYSLFCLVIWYYYHFDTITCFSTSSYPSIQRCPLMPQTNVCLNFWKHSSIQHFRKNNQQLPSKISMLEFCMEDMLSQEFSGIIKLCKVNGGSLQV